MVSLQVSLGVQDEHFVGKYLQALTLDRPVLDRQGFSFEAVLEPTTRRTHALVYERDVTERTEGSQ